MTKQEKDNRVPIWERMNLTVEEAAAYTGIGTDKLRELSNRESCDFVLWVGTKRLLKRKQLEEFLIKSCQSKKVRCTTVLQLPSRCERIKDCHN